MKVFIKNKLMSVGGSSEVLDENKQPAFYVKGRAMSITRVKYVCDVQGNRLFKLRNKWFNWFVHKVYIYDAEGTKIATVKDKWFNLKSEYFVVGCKDEIKVEGGFVGRGLQIYRNGQCIGALRIEVTIVADAFTLEADPADIPFLIALVIAIDNIRDKRKH